jgi:crotonobetainyl-CoA:carnitine CoA-transferase CaiB-like acyl-CoA transferase
MGANVAIVAILGALEQRDRSGRGQCIDLSMQDIACWLTAPVWNGALTRQPRPAVLRCLDGYVAIDAGVQAGIASSLPPLAFAGLTAEAALLLTRAELAARLTQAGLPAAPVHTLNEAATWPQTRARRNWFHLREGGMDAPSLACPIRLQRAPLPDLRPAPALDQDRDDILRELGIDGAGAALERISMRR